MVELGLLKKAIYAFSIRFLGIGTNYLLLFVVGIYCTNETLGKYGWTITTATIFATIASAGVPILITAKLPTFKENSEASIFASHCLSGTILVSLIFYSGLTVSFLIVGATGMNWQELAVGLAILPFIVIVENVGTCLRVENRIFWAFGPRELLWRSATITLVIMVILIWPTAIQTITVLACSTIGIVLSSAIQLVIYKIHFPFPRPALLVPATIGKILKESLPYLWTRSSQVAINNFDVFLVGLISNSSLTGIYFVSTRLCKLTELSTNTILQIFGPEYAKSYAKRDYPRLNQLLNYTKLISITLAVIFLFAIFLFGKDLLFLFRINDDEAELVLNILIVGDAAFCIGAAYGLIMGLTDRKEIEAKVTALAAVAGITFMSLAGIFGGFTGIALARSATKIVNSFALYAVEKKSRSF